MGNRELWSRSADGNVTKCVHKALKNCHKIKISNKKIKENFVIENAMKTLIFIIQGSL